MLPILVLCAVKFVAGQGKSYPRTTRCTDGGSEMSLYRYTDITHCPLQMVTTTP